MGHLALWCRGLALTEMVAEGRSQGELSPKTQESSLGGDPRAKRIDVHVHLGGLGTGGSGISVSRRLRRSFLLKMILKSQGIAHHELDRADEIYVERLANQVREATNLDQVVALAMDGRYRDGKLDRDHSALVVPNEWSRDASRAHPELLFGASVNPLRPDALDALDQVIDEGAVLLKWLPNTMGFHTDDKAHEPFYRKLADHGLPLLSHCGMEFSLPGGTQRLGDPFRLRRALDQGVTVIAAHCGTLSPGWWHGAGLRSGPETLALMMDEYPRLYADLSAMTSFLRGWSLRSVLDDERLRPRLLEASDFPVPCFPVTQLGRVPIADIRRARRMKNFFDKDRFLKTKAGTDEAMDFRAARILRLPDGRS